MTSATYPIRGIAVKPGAALPVRREINEWAEDVQNKKQVDLFMLALKAMQETEHTDLLSYYRIAGIHSYPLQDWDGVKYRDQPEPDLTPGFCAHNLAIFPTWHRPYMLLFEQHLHTLMTDIITAWRLHDEEARPWLNAAETFRLPYWDWGQKQPYIDDFGIPEICTKDTVTVTLPQGETKTFGNPLAKFSNPSGVAMGDKSMDGYKIIDHVKNDTRLPWSKCIGTSRYGIYNDKPVKSWEKGVNNWEKVNIMIKKPEWYGPRRGDTTFADAIERLLDPKTHKTFDGFASTQYNNPKDTKNSSYMSLEYIHNNAHVMTGGFFAQTDSKGATKATGLGHMSDVPVSAFDPVFWLHHCNIDRLLAIWQTFNDDKWFSSTAEPGPDTALLPFHIDDSGSFWNSHLARNWTQYGYEYSELVRVPADYDDQGRTFNKQRYLERLRLHFNKLYKGASNAVKNAPGFASADGEFPDFIVNIIYDRYALEGQAYAILLFLGEPPQGDDLYSFSQHENYLGQVYTFSSPIQIDGDVACANCQTQKTQRVLSKAQVPVTIQLMQKASMQQQWHAEGQAGPSPLGVVDPMDGPLTPRVVEQLFQQQFSVVYIALGGEVLDASLFPQTEIALLHAPATYTLESGPETDVASDGAVVPSYDGQYKVLYRHPRGPDSAPVGSPDTEAPGAGYIQDDPDRA